MDLSKGFQIEEPCVFVPWDTSESKFLAGFEGLQLRRVTYGYFTTHCVSLGGLSHFLGFHFWPRGDGRLLEFEFFRAFPDLDGSYKAFQRHLEATFGQPTITTPGLEGYPSHTWRLPGADVRHSVQEHFGVRWQAASFFIGECRSLFFADIITKVGAPSLRFLQGREPRMQAASASLSCGTVAKPNPAPTNIHMHRSGLAKKIETITAPSPLLR